MDDDLFFDDYRDQKCDKANQKIYLSASMTMTATGTEAYEILKSQEKELHEAIQVNCGSPEITKKKEKKTISKHKNITTELLLDTEQYRIGEIFNLLKSDAKDTVKQQAIRYLLSYSDLLDVDIAKDTVAIANNMLKESGVRGTVKVKIAADLKAFLGSSDKKKFIRSTFEELRKEDGILEVEVPD